ncbi:hypothetical protein HZS_216 [Henneguya salminicola]|nr:hypothetical protein HZS_216 [Henneguya salminicola]
MSHWMFYDDVSNSIRVSNDRLNLFSLNFRLLMFFYFRKTIFLQFQFGHINNEDGILRYHEYTHTRKNLV